MADKTELEKVEEYAINQETKNGDIEDKQFADTLKKAREKAENLEYWSIEKVIDWGCDSEGVVKREHELIEESDN